MNIFVYKKSLYLKVYDWLICVLLMSSHCLFGLFLHMKQIKRVILVHLTTVLGIYYHQFHLLQLLKALFSATMTTTCLNIQILVFKISIHSLNLELKA